MLQINKQRFLFNLTLLLKTNKVLKYIVDFYSDFTDIVIYIDINCLELKIVIFNVGIH